MGNAPFALKDKSRILLSQCQLRSFCFAKTHRLKRRKNARNVVGEGERENVCVCVCVRERERERECVCVCVCVCYCRLLSVRKPIMALIPRWLRQCEKICSDESVKAISSALCVTIQLRSGLKFELQFSRKSRKCGPHKNSGTNYDEPVSIDHDMMNGVTRM